MQQQALGSPRRVRLSVEFYEDEGLVMEWRYDDYSPLRKAFLKAGFVEREVSNLWGKGLHHLALTYPRGLREYTRRYTLSGLKVLVEDDLNAPLIDISGGWLTFNMAFLRVVPSEGELLREGVGLYVPMNALMGGLGRMMRDYLTRVLPSAPEVSLDG
ncbi:MAG: hypothetical protein QXJ48_02325 [Candidatus Korarchaeum sp.]